MPRWLAKEVALIAEVRQRLATLIDASPNYPEVTGDRKVVRFLRGHDYNVNKVCDLMAKFLRWREANNVNAVRENIVQGGCDHPLKFPKGEIILRLIPQLVIAPDALDRLGSPLCVEQYCFSPNEVLNQISIQDYIEFVIYSLEYRSIILEQMSEEYEQKYLDSLSPEELEELETDPDSPPYGVLAQSCVIRDLRGVGLEHLGSNGQEIIRAVVSLASDNYPELMRKCYMINTPWVFNTIWFFIKGLLAPRTIAKVSVMGSSYMDEIGKDIQVKYLPTLIGGSYEGYLKYVPYPFDLAYLSPGSRRYSIDPTDLSNLHSKDMNALVPELHVDLNKVTPQSLLTDESEETTSTPLNDNNLNLASAVHRDVHAPPTSSTNLLQVAPATTTGTKERANSKTLEPTEVGLITLVTSG